MAHRYPLDKVVESILPCRISMQCYISPWSWEDTCMEMSYPGFTSMVIWYTTSENLIGKLFSTDLYSERFACDLLAFLPRLHSASHRQRIPGIGHSLPYSTQSTNNIHLLEVLNRIGPNNKRLHSVFSKIKQRNSALLSMLEQWWHTWTEHIVSKYFSAEIQYKIWAQRRIHFANDILFDINI